MAEVEKAAPHWRDWFDEPPSDNPLAQRTDKAVRYPREFEAIRPYMLAAQLIAERFKPVSKREFRKLAQDVSARVMTVPVYVIPSQEPKEVRVSVRMLPSQEPAQREVFIRTAKT